MIGKVLLGLTFTHLFVQVPIMISFHYAAELIGMAMYSPFPPLYVRARPRPASTLAPVSLTAVRLDDRGSCATGPGGRS